jgi:hypothetical protein
MSNEIIEKIKQAIEGFKDQTEWEEIGKVVEVGDGILKISGLLNVQAQEVLMVETSPSAHSARSGQALYSLRLSRVFWPDSFCPIPAGQKTNRRAKANLLPPRF